MNFEEELAAADKIADPVEREKRIAEIMRMMMGSPARAAVTPPAIVATPAQLATAPVEPKPADVQQIRKDIDLTKKLDTTTNLNAMSDEELESLIGGFSGQITPEAAQEELTAREGSTKKSALRLAGQVVGSAAEIPTSSPIALAGLLAKGAEFATGADLSADQLLLAAEDIRQKVRSSVGISDPRNVRESIAGLVPSIVPVPGFKAPVSTLGNLAEIVTPVVIGSGNKRILANLATGFGVEQAVREAADVANDPYKTIFDQAGITGSVVEDTNYPEALKVLGVGLAGMAGASIVTPMLVKAWTTQRSQAPARIASIRSIDPHGPANLSTLETAGDLYKTYLVDEKAVLKDIYKRGMAPDFDEVAKLIDQDTQMSALMRVNEAMRTGQLRTKFGNFIVDKTPNQLLMEANRLPTQMRQDVDLYLKNMNYADILKERLAVAAKSKTPNAAAMATDQQNLRLAQQAAYEISLRTPVALEFSKAYRDITGSVRNFLSQGQNSMISGKRLQELAVNRPNFVPSDVLGVDPTEGLAKRLKDVTRPIEQRTMDDWYRQGGSRIEGVEHQADSFELLADYTRNALKSKMEHDVRGAYARGIQNSPLGKETFRKATGKEVRDFPNRIVEVWEDGKRVKYISSQLQAQLIKFDPNVAKHAWAFVPKRIFELGTTGVASVTFAPITMLRDTLAGFVLAAPGTKGPGTWEVPAAAAKQIWAKTQLALVENLENSMVRIPFLPEQSRKQLSQQMSNAYMNSFYHMAQQVGGTDASLMKHNVQAARGVLRELSRSMEGVRQLPGARLAGRPISVLLEGFNNLFDAVQEAPRLAAAERMFNSGMDLSEAVQRARSITGDTTLSGRVYDTRGVRIDADAINKGALAPAAVVGPAVQFVREATPFFNPMVQGLRKLGTSLIDNPVETNIKAWLAMGLPSLLMMGWNEMLGEEYNRYSFEERSSNNIAMNMYMGLPGRPPEEGIQIPIPHELALYGSPWTAGVYSMMRGGEGDEVQSIMRHMAGTALENMAMVGFPQVMTAGLATAGQRGPTSLINPMGWQDDMYQLREDNVGLMPQNVEATLRTLFGSAADMALVSAAAMWEGGPEAFFEEMGYNIAKRTPLLKGPLGTVTPVTNFTPQSEKKQTKIKALRDFIDIYEEHFEKQDLLRKRALPKLEGKDDSFAQSMVGLEPPTGVVDGDETTFRRMGPLPSPTPSNPIYEVFGELIKDTLKNNDIGYDALDDRYNLFSQQIRNLKTFTAGKKEGFREWQKAITGSEAKLAEANAVIEGKKQNMSKGDYTAALKGLSTLQESAKLERLLREQKLDLSKRSDVMKLIGYMERERFNMMNEQIKMIEQVEDKVTEGLINLGFLRPGQKFSVEKHLGRLPPREFLTPSPNNPNPEGQQAVPRQ